MGAVALSLVIAAQASAASWSPSTTLASAAATFVNGIATLADGTAVIVWVECHEAQICYDVGVRRSTDGGQTWQPAMTLASGSFFASIAGRGSSVDVAWSEGGELMYARSTDSGASFGRNRRLATTGGDTGIGRGPGGVVAVAWTASFDTGSIKARVSVDGGQSFGPRNTVVSSADDAGNDVAVGDGVAYVTYMSGGDLYVKRSVDFGASWSSPSLITANAHGSQHRQFDIAAEGDNAYVVYTAANGSIRMRQSVDAGATWLPETVINRRDDLGSAPSVSVQGGVVRVVYNESDGLFYRESNDGIAWSSAEFVSGAGFWAEVGFAAGHVIVPFNVRVNNHEMDVRVRTRQ